MRKAIDAITEEGVYEKIGLMRRFMKTILHREPTIGVCALNCHAGDGGLFGDEEIRIIAPAVKRAQEERVDVAGPYPADTLLLDAKNGLYDGIVAMYHDQGHIAVKALDMFAAVNVALGLPIVRTSVAHGTAFNIAGQGIATTKSLIEAVRVAALFAQRAKRPDRAVPRTTDWRNNDRITPAPGRIAMEINAKDAALKILNWAQRQDFEGIDPYDALNSPLAGPLTLGTKIGRIALTKSCGSPRQSAPAAPHQTRTQPESARPLP